MEIEMTLKERAEQIRDEQETGANTAERVGGLLVSMCDAHEELKTEAERIARGLVELAELQAQDKEELKSIIEEKEAELKADINKLAERITEEHDITAELVESVRKALQATIEANKAESDKSLEDINTTISEIQAALEEHKTTLDNHEERIATVESSVEAIREDADKAQQDAEEAAHSAEQANTRLGEINAALENLSPDQQAALELSEKVNNAVAKNAEQDAKHSELDSKVYKIYNDEVNISLSVEQGSIKSVDGTDGDNSARIRTSGFIVSQSIRVVVANCKYYVHGYDDNGGYKGNNGGWRPYVGESGDDTYTIEGATKYRLVFAEPTFGDITPSDFSAMGVSVYAKAGGLTDDEKESIRKNLNVVNKDDYDTFSEQVSESLANNTADIENLNNRADVIESVVSGEKHELKTLKYNGNYINDIELKAGVEYKIKVVVDATILSNSPVKLRHEDNTDIITLGYITSENKTLETTYIPETTESGCKLYMQLFCKEDNPVGYMVIESGSVIDGIKNEISTINKKINKNIDVDLEKDDLSITPISIVRNKAEGIDACYRLTHTIGDKMSMHLKVAFPNDMHDVSGLFKIFNIKSAKSEANGYDINLRLQKSPTSESNKYPVPNYESNIRLYEGNDPTNPLLKPDGFKRDFMLGDDMAALRFNGDCTVSANQDIRMKIDASVVKIYHSSNNVTIASFNKADYSDFKALYVAMSNATADGGNLSEFEMKPLNILNHVPSDIIMGDFPLIASYRHDQNDSSIVGYDAFPYYFTSKPVDMEEHDIEILFNKNDYSADNNFRINIKIDGLQLNGNLGNGKYVNAKNVHFFDTNLTITIGDDSKSNSGIVVKSLRIVDDYKSALPNMRTIYYEGVMDSINEDSLYSSKMQAPAMASYLRSIDYKNVATSDMQRYANNNLNTDGDNFLVFYDDNGYQFNMVNNQEIVNLHLQNELKPNVAFMLSSEFTDETKKNIALLKNSGYDFSIHSCVDTISANKSIGYFTYAELKDRVSRSIEKYKEIVGFFPTVWDYHLAQENYNTSRYLKNQGFSLIFGGADGSGEVSRINRLCCFRIRAPFYTFGELGKIMKR